MMSARLLLLCGLVHAPIFSAFSAEEGSKPKEEAPKVNEYLMPKMEEIIKNSMKVIQEDEGVVSVTLMNGHSLVKDTTVLFFRKKHSRLEMIANGKVLTDEVDPKLHQPVLKVELDKDTVIKYPHEGDYAAPMSDPAALGEGNKKDENDYLLPDEDQNPKENDRPGYLEGALGLLYGNYSTTSSTVANNAKQPSAYRFQNQHFAYFLEFFPIGFEYDAHSGKFPTSDYYSNISKSDESVNTIGIFYRFRPLFDQHLGLAGKVMLLSDQFNTLNQDENLLTTKTSGTGLGLRGSWDFEKANWRPTDKKKRLGFVLQSFAADFNYFPIILAQDVGVSRGTGSSGSSALQLRLSATALLWVDYIPFLKRWVAQGSFGLRSYSLKFNGATTLENTAFPVPIPSGGTSSEKEIDFRFFFGVRFDDPLKSLFESKKGRGK